MNRPAIMIRDIHHYGDDLTVPEAVARLRDGGQVTVTVTDPAPPEGDPRGNPRHGFDITVRPALGGQPEPPPEISWEARSFETPDSAALFAEALTLASQLAACAGPAGGQSASARRRPTGPPTAGRRAARPRPRHARRLPRHHRPAQRRRPDRQRPVRHARAGRPARHPRHPDLARGFGIHLAAAPCWPRRGRLLHRRRRSLLRRGRTHRPRPRRPAPRHQQPARRGMNPRRAKARTPGPHRETRQKEQTPMTEYKLNHFTMADAQALAGKTADITEWDNDELEPRSPTPARESPASSSFPARAW